MTPARATTLLATLSLAFVAFAATSPAAASPECVREVGPVGFEDAWCVHTEGCHGVAGDPEGAHRYAGLAYCEDASGCYLWTNGQRAETDCILGTLA